MPLDYATFTSLRYVSSMLNASHCMREPASVCTSAVRGPRYVVTGLSKRTEPSTCAEEFCWHGAHMIPWLIRAYNVHKLVEIGVCTGMSTVNVLAQFPTTLRRYYLVDPCEPAPPPGPVRTSAASSREPDASSLHCGRGWQQMQAGLRMLRSHRQDGTHLARGRSTLARLLGAHGAQDPKRVARPRVRGRGARLSQRAKRRARVLAKVEAGRCDGGARLCALAELGRGAA